MLGVIQQYNIYKKTATLFEKSNDCIVRNASHRASDLVQCEKENSELLRKVGKDVEHMNKLERYELQHQIKIELLHKKDDEKAKNTLLWVLAIVGAVAAIAGIAYAVYKFFTPDYLEDFEEDFEDDFDDDFFSDDDEV